MARRNSSPVGEELSELKAKEGVFAVLGNHDCKDGTADILSKKGIRVLINEHIPTLPEEGLSLHCRG